MARTQFTIAKLEIRRDTLLTVRNQLLENGRDQYSDVNKSKRRSPHHGVCTYDELQETQTSLYEFTAKVTEGGYVHVGDRMEAYCKIIDEAENGEVEINSKGDLYDEIEARSGLAFSEDKKPFRRQVKALYGKWPGNDGPHWELEEKWTALRDWWRERRDLAKKWPPP